MATKRELIAKARLHVENIDLGSTFRCDVAVAIDAICDVLDGEYDEPKVSSMYAKIEAILNTAIPTIRGTQLAKTLAELFDRELSAERERVAKMSDEFEAKFVADDDLEAASAFRHLSNAIRSGL